jgi:hypothetical protein
MQITCPACGNPIPTQDVNVQTSIARCLACGEVFNFTAQVGGGAPGKAPVAMPKSFSLSQEMADLVITRRWFSAKYIFLAVFCCLWNGFLVFMGSKMLEQSGQLVALTPLSIHGLVGVIIAYIAVAGFVNSSTFRINAQVVSVRHGPLPWAGARDVPVSQIDQLYCTEVISRTRNGTSVTYSVIVRTHDEKKIVLVSNLDTVNDARYLEQQIEARLGIADQAVGEEAR